MQPPLLQNALHCSRSGGESGFWCPVASQSRAFPTCAVTAHPMDEARTVRSGRRLSVVLPMWNEGPNIARTVEAAREACSALVPAGEFSDFELIIVNDASTDGTGEVADRMAEADPRIRVVHHDRNRRLGASIRS